MKIIIDARFLGTEAGIGRYVKEIVENLEYIDSQNQYIIFLTKKNWDLYSPKSPNFIKRLVEQNWYSIGEQVFLPGIIKKENADLCFFPHFNVPVFSRTAYVVMIHDLILRHFPTSNASTKNPVIFYLKYFLYNLVLHRALKKAKKIIVPSYFVRNDIISQFKINADKVRVIYEGLSNIPQNESMVDGYLQEKGIFGPYILYVGNQYPHKNTERLAQAFLQLKKEHPQLQLVFIGKRDYFSKRLESKIKANSEFAEIYPKDILFLGHISDKELAILYKNAKVYAFPSLMEGFGLPVLEALSFDLPVCCSDIPVFHEVLGDGVLYFNPKSISSIKNALACLLTNEKQRYKISQKKDTILKRYSSLKTAKATLEVFNGK